MVGSTGIRPLLTMQNPELTILSVFHSPHSARFLELNEEFARAKNSSKNWVWLVADNAPEEGMVRLDPQKFTVIEGLRKRPEAFSQGMRGSYHHAAALNKLLPYIKTRFALILDGDCYITYPEWAKTVPEYMRKNDLAFFGPPWHTRWWIKVRYFPAHHALFMDLDKIRKEELDFLPQYDEGSFKNIQDAKGQGRRGIGISRDTSYALYSRFAKRPDIKYECAVPVFLPAEEWGYSPSVLKRALSYFLPDRLSYIPKKKGYFTETSFKKRGYFDARSLGWEEFVWRDLPFCFHLRKTAAGQASSPEDELRIVREALISFQK